MILSSWVRSCCAAIATSCALSAAVYYYNKRRAEDVDEVMVFCKLQFNAYDYFDKLIGHVEAARESINVCMSSIHNPAIQSRLIPLLNKNIKIRIIIDKEGYNQATKFLIKELIAAGAEIKIKHNICRLEHKFCLIDDKVLVTGTFDWGQDRSADTWNYAYITSRIRLVYPVKKDFYNIWNNYSCNLELLKEPANVLPQSECLDINNIYSSDMPALSLD